DRRGCPGDGRRRAPEQPGRYRAVGHRVRGPRGRTGGGRPVPLRLRPPRPADQAAGGSTSERSAAAPSASRRLACCWRCL
ncbi:MAG: hypothetical protein AVDCRST_MAG09-1701, partial [uncultured Sphingomonas sp.]